MLIFWIAVFVVSLFALVKGADFLLTSSEKVGLSIGLSPFVVGVTIVAFGTSFPELVSSFVAVSQGVSEIVSANAIGSNIANILLVAGIAAIVGRRLSVTKDLIDLDLPLIAITTTIFFMVAYDGEVNLFESIFLLITYVIYLGFSLIYKDDEASRKPKKPKVTPTDLLMLVIGIVGLAIGAKYLVDSIIALADLLSITAGVIAISAVAIGTSLPELIVSTKAAMRRHSEVALGNIFGSNVFNVLVVVGLPGIFGTIVLDEKTLAIGLPVLAISTLLLIISGISRRIHVQEGTLYVLLYIIFTAKLFGLF
jgi:cation:H+ antiporter